jgi:acyl-CoA ligase (AMP-forming) (exosortase A-associated)
MPDSTLLHELVERASQRWPTALALTAGATSIDYGSLQCDIERFAAALVAGLGLRRGERVAIYLEKRFEVVIASFGAPAAGCVCVPLNPLLKPDQVAYILRDCNVRVLVTSAERLRLLSSTLQTCADLRHVVAIGPPEVAVVGGVNVLSWAQFLSPPPDSRGHRVIDTDMAAILYTSGSTGKPKGVVLSHRNLVAGAKSVASYLANDERDTLLAALPLSFDAGFSQLSTAFHAGARVVLLNYLLPRDVLKAMDLERVTGLTAVPPLYIQLAQLEWPANVQESLRYFANTGGRMPRETLALLRRRVPRAKPFLMYGLTEAFRSTYLPPDEVDRRPDSIGKAIPNAEILVLRSDGTECAVDEPGELVHRGALVGMGYWNDAAKTGERYRALPPGVGGREAGLQLPEIAVFSGDTVRRDSDGFMYFIGRRDEMIKTSGYRVSPTEVEEVLYATKLIGECAAFGVEHEILGQTIHVVATPPEGATEVDIAALLVDCRVRMPAYMVPALVHQGIAPLPRNPNGKIDRKALAEHFGRPHTPARHDVSLRP